jgi:hypothetical protein
MHWTRLWAIAVVVGNPLARYALPHSISPLAFFGTAVVGGIGAVVPGLGIVVPGIVVAEAGGFSDAPTLVLAEDPQAARTTARIGYSRRVRRFVG